VADPARLRLGLAAREGIAFMIEVEDVVALVAVTFSSL
jgi:hypothetical protein